MKEKNKKKFLVATGGLLVGIVNGFFGAGGGMLAVPILKTFGKIESKKAHATTVLTMLPICLISAVGCAISGTIDIGVLWPVLIGTVAGGIVGTMVLSRLKNNVISVIFGALMLCAGIILIVKN